MKVLKDFLNFFPSESTARWAKVSVCDAKKPTVILVTGFAASHRTLSVIRRRFLKDGYNVLVLSMDFQDLSDSVRGLYFMAEKLSKTVLELKKKIGMRDTPVYLVAHSAGGLVARYYVQQLGGFHYCEKLITMATPHRGTWLALLGFFTHLVLKFRCLYQLLPISLFIHHLNDSNWHHGFEMISLSSRHDPICWRTMAKLPEKLAKEEGIISFELKHLRHSDFLLSKKVYALLKKALEVPYTSFSAIS